MEPFTPIYLEKGAAFTSEAPPIDIGCICPYMKVLGFQYAVPLSSVSEYSRFRNIPEQQIFEWHGFGAGYCCAEE